MKPLLSTLFILLLTSHFASAQDAIPLPSPLPEHPRIFFTSQKQAEIEKLAETDEFLKKQIAVLIEKADKAKTAGVSKYLIPDGVRLLDQSRRSLDRTTTLAFAYRMTGDQTYADAAVEEMLAVCRFKNWNPAHYLDTAEMAAAVGLGYDWLHDVIPEAEKTEIRESLKKHALETGLEFYEKNSGWAKSHNNWNEVCNSGLTLAALAVAEDEPELAAKIINYAVKSIPNGLSVYQPDGAYPEGPIYWSYGGTFCGAMIMALRDVFGDDFGLAATPGFDVTGDYYMGMISPTYTNFNYADCGERAESTPLMYALSHFHNRPDYALWLRKFYEAKNPLGGGRWAVMQVLWYNPAGADADFENTPRAKLFRGVQDVVTMRTAWNDPDAWFVGFKGGDNKANHGHLDTGSFVLDYAGVRWATDLGADDYNLPEYFGHKRWDYYRNNNRSHNTLVIGEKIQHTWAVGRITEFGSEAGMAFAACDMTEAYSGQAKSAKRVVSLTDEGDFVITDFIKDVSETVRWGMVTRADVTISDDGQSATLSHSGKAIRVSFLPESDAKFEIIPTTPPTEKENQNQGTVMLAIFAEPEDGDVTLSVFFRAVVP